MNLAACPREKEIAVLLALGAWPQAAAPELCTHAATCRACADLVLVTQTFQQARAQSAAAAPLAAPGAIWWRAQLRRRNAAVERMGRPLLGAQIFALAVNLVLAVGFLGWEARHGFAWLNWLEQLRQDSALHLDALWPSTLFTSGWSPALLIPVLAMLALVGGVVVYLGSEKQ
jgi:hypothetical protein